jgi:outer membrane receptor for ferrienterochelin and colicin
MSKILISLKTTLVIIVLSNLLIAGVTGKISGKITDLSNGEPLAGVNVYLENTSIGTTTDANGDYFMLNIPPGSYNLKTSMIGYGLKTVEGVRVSIDITTFIDVDLTVEALQAEEVTVVAERALLKNDDFSSRHSVSGDDILVQPVDDFKEVAKNQAGIVGNHFRGGRANEVLVLVDGIPMRDPAGIYSGDLGGFTANIPDQAIQELEVTLGGFGAEYGNVQSGVLNLAMKEGSKNFHGNFKITTTNFGDGLNDALMGERTDWLGTTYQHQLKNIYQLSISGPLPLNSSFSVSGEITDKDQGYLLNEQSSSTSLHGKLTTNLSSKIKLVLGGLYSNQEWDEFYFPASKYGPAPDYSFNEYKEVRDGTLYHYIYVEDPENYQQGIVITQVGSYGGDDYEQVSTYYVAGMQEYLWDREQTNRTGYLVWTHTLNSKTYYEIRLHNAYSNYHYATKDIEDDDGDGNTSEELAWDVDSDGPVPEYRERENNYWWIRGDDPGFRDQTSTTNTIKGDFVSQLNINHMLKAGFEFAMHNTNVENISWTLNLGSARKDIWEEDSYDLGVYIQDKMEFKGIMALVGLRYDMFNPNGLDSDIVFPADYEYPYSAVDENDTPIFTEPKTATVKSQISPRIGISHPITDRDLLHFTYGHYFQRPDAYFLYRNHTIQALTKVGNYIGNPDLKPEKTVAYDFGVEHLFSDDMKISVTGFYKDVTNLIDWYKYVGKSIQNIELNVYTNADYGNIKGLELAFEKRMGKYWGGSFNYTFSVAKGRSSSYTEGAGTFSSARKMNILDFDQTHTANVNLSLIIPENSKLGSVNVWKFQPLANWRANFNIDYGSGLPYTSYNSSIVNDARLPWKSTTDLRISKMVNIREIANVQVFLDIFNLFNRENIDGQFFQDYGSPQYYELENDPSIIRKDLDESYIRNPQVYSDERQIRLGLSVQF